MPKMNGLEVLDKLKSSDQTKHIPVIMLTNLAGQQDAEAALAKGAVKYIIKSEHDPKEVADLVKEIIAGYTRNDVPSAAASTTPSHASSSPTDPPSGTPTDLPVAPPLVTSNLPGSDPVAPPTGQSA